MYSYLMVSEVARQRMAEQHEAARKASPAAGSPQGDEGAAQRRGGRRVRTAADPRLRGRHVPRGGRRGRGRMRGLLTPPTAAGYSAPRPGHTGVGSAAAG